MCKDKGKEKRVVDQEILPHTEFKRIPSTIATRKRDLKRDFEFLYREVSVDRTNTVNKTVSADCPSLTGSSEGVENLYGNPIDVFDPTDDDESNEVRNDTRSDLVLDTLKSVRLDHDAFNISLDTEYQDLGDGKRAILSYQFAFYPPCRHDIVVEVVILPKGSDLKSLKRITLAAALGVIFDMPYFGRKTIEYRRTREYVLVVPHMPYFNGDLDGYERRETYKTREEAEDAGDALVNRIYLVNSYHCETQHDYKEARKAASHVQLVCHNGIVDLSAFADDPHHFSLDGTHSVLEYVTEVQKGCISMEPIFMTIPSARRYWEFYPIKLSFRDTMCLAPQGNRSLDALGKMLGVPKLELPDGAIEHMGEYLQEAPEDFLAYATEDALVTLLYGSSLFGINKEWIATTTSGSGRVFKDRINDYFCDTLSEYGPKEFDAVFRGIETAPQGLKSTPAGLRPEKEYKQINSDCKILDAFSTDCYMGGYNACFNVGLFHGSIYDYDLKSAYPTAMCIVADIDYEDPIKVRYHDHWLSLKDISKPNALFFGEVDFEFPEAVNYPCIPQFCDGCMIYTRTGEGVYATGPEIYLALRMGATIYCHNGFLCNALATKDGDDCHSLAYAVKRIVSDRALASEIWGKKGLIPTLLKLLVNGGYGKTAQDIKTKHRYSPWTKRMEDMGPSCITCPEKASMVTSLVRAQLLATMNELSGMGYTVYSVTTDGFLCDCDAETLDSCEAYGIGRLFCDARAYLEDVDKNDVTCWELKHRQKTLLSITTRGNIGYGCYDECGHNLGVLAHNSYRTGEIKGSDADRQEFFKAVMLREGPVVTTDERFANIKDIIEKRRHDDKDIDFYEQTVIRNLSMDFDMKRKPDRNSMRAVYCDGIHDDHIQFDLDAEMVNFGTVPYKDISEYQQYREAGHRQTCLRTVKNWESFYLRLGNGSDQHPHLKDPDWKKLQSVIIGYRQGLWDIPMLDACKSVDEKLDKINEMNKSEKRYTRENWKDAGRKDRKKSVLKTDLIQDLLDKFDAKIL